MRQRVPKFLGHGLAVGLVIREVLVPLRGRFRVEHHREMGRALVGLHVVEQLPQHVAEAEHGVDLQPVRLARERRQRMVGAEDVARAVDQEDVVALFERPGNGRGLGGGSFGGGGSYGGGGLIGGGAISGGIYIGSAAPSPGGFQGGNNGGVYQGGSAATVPGPGPGTGPRGGR